MNRRVLVRIASLQSVQLRELREEDYERLAASAVAGVEDYELFRREMTITAVAERAHRAASSARRDAFPVLRCVAQPVPHPKHQSRLRLARLARGDSP